MLAKIWKKVLLIICIIACLYNVMHKLVSRVSLEVQLKSVQNQSGFINEIENDTDMNHNTTQNSSAEYKNTTNHQEKDPSTGNHTTVVIY